MGNGKIRICDIEDCENRHYGHGFCERHYESFRKYGDPLAVTRRKEARARWTCSYGGCNRTDRGGRDFCRKHYSQGLINGWWAPRKICTYGPCERRRYCKGLCKSHYKQLINGSPLQPLIPGPRPADRDQEGRKYCPSCTNWLPESSFNRNGSKPDKLTATCKGCLSKAMQLKRYGVVAPEGCVCEICGSDNHGKTLHVDHDHACCTSYPTCGKCVRGFLCYTCNVWVSVLDNSAWREKGELYLDKYRAAVADRHRGVAA